MKKISILLIALALSVIACKNDKKKTEAKEEVIEAVEEKVETPKKLKIALNAKSNSSVSGNAVFKEENGTVTMTAIIDGLEPGSHAIHIHQTADCSYAPL